MGQIKASFLAGAAFKLRSLGEFSEGPDDVVSSTFLAAFIYSNNAKRLATASLPAFTSGARSKRSHFSFIETSQLVRV